MTKNRFLLKMNWRLFPLKRTRRAEIINHYRSIIDQSMANGNTEESAVDSLGSVNTLCRLVLRRENRTVLFPVIAGFMHFIKVLLAGVCLIAAIGFLLGIVGVFAYLGYTLVSLILHSLLPSAVLFSSNMFAGIFKAGACLVAAAVIIVLFLIAKTVLIWAFRVLLFIFRKIKEGIYRAQSTKLMKGGFRA